MHDRDDDGADDQADDRRRRGVDQPSEHAAGGLDRVVDGLLPVVNQTVRRVPAEVVGPDEQDVAADPEHRRGADHRQRREQFGHARDQAAADALRELATSAA